MANTKLRQIRLKHGKSVKEMSDYIGVSQSAYEKVEYGQRTPSYNFIKKFKEKFPSYNADEIFFEINHTENV